MAFLIVIHFLVESFLFISFCYFLILLHCFYLYVVSFISLSFLFEKYVLNLLFQYFLFLQEFKAIDFHVIIGITNCYQFVFNVPFLEISQL